MRELLVMLMSAGAVYMTDATIPDDLKGEYQNLSAALTLSAGCSKMFGDTASFQAASVEFEKFLAEKAELPNAKEITQETVERLEQMPLTHLPPFALTFVNKEVCGNIREAFKATDD